jgi:O-antigen ligase
MVQRLLRENWVLAACVAFAVLNGLLVAREVYWLNLLPAVLLVLWAMVASLDRLMLFIVFTTPLSINLEELDLGGIGVSLPTEPLMVGITLLFVLKLGLERRVLDPAVLAHPITLVIGLHLLWMAVCIVPSSMPVVSVKHFLARLWFVTTMYFVATLLFRRQGTMRAFGWSYVAGLSIVVVYTLIRHAQYDFAHDPGHWVMEPFFKDHTSYGAALALILPFLVTSALMPANSRTRRGLALVLLVVIGTGLVFSYTRAAWLSLAGAVGMLLVMRLRIPAWALLIGGVTLGGLYYVNEERITLALERNREESSDDLGEHVRSISNISSDASNLERINRWNSALRMWKERPVFGWGPGTYMFQYAPFQASADRTIISTNFGLGGNAHSEYLGPLSEQGVPGMLLMLVLVGLVTHRALKLYARMPTGTDRLMLKAAYLGLVTYYLHGALNNYLDLDKASVPFWGFTAMVVVLDTRYPAGKPGEWPAEPVS